MFRSAKLRIFLLLCRSVKRFLFTTALNVLIPCLLHAQIFPSFGDSRTATTGWQFLKFDPCARSAAMSGAFLAVTDDVSALYWDPAGLTRMDSAKYHAEVDHTHYVSNTSLSFAGIAHRINKNSVLGVSMQYFDSGNMDVTTEFMPFGTGQTFRASDLGLGVSFAQQLTKLFAYGVTVKYIREQLAEVHTQNVVFDFGFQYDIGIANTRFAVGISNFGFNTAPQGSITAETLAGTVTYDDFKSIAVPTVFRLGFAWDALKNENNILTCAAQLNHPTDNNETYALGLEYGWHHILYARTGYLFASDESAFPTFGFGFTLPRYFGALHIDYAYCYENHLGSIHRIGIGLNF